MQYSGGLKLYRQSRPMLDALHMVCLGMLLYFALAAAMNRMLSITMSLPGMASAAAGAVLTSVLACRRRRVLYCIPLLMAAVALCIWTQDITRGAVIALSRLFAASEAANRYAYVRLNVPVDPSAIIRCEQAFLMLASFAGGCVCVVCSRRKPCLLALMTMYAGLQLYFGLTPDPVRQICLLIIAALVLCGDLQMKNLLACLLVIVVIAALTVLLIPGVHLPLEERSEQWRDQLDAWMQGGVTYAQPDEAGMNLTRKENRLAELPVDDPAEEGVHATEYEKQIRYQDEISVPHVLNLQRIILLFVLMFALLVGPFVPFIMWERKKRGVLQAMEVLHNESPAVAVCAMLPQLVRWLQAYGMPDDNQTFVSLAGWVQQHFPKEIAEQYVSSVEVWQRATYSDSPVSEQERDALTNLLHAVERHVNEHVDFRTRLRIHYVDLLFVSEEDA